MNEQWSQIYLTEVFKVRLSRKYLQGEAGLLDKPRLKL